MTGKPSSKSPRPRESARDLERWSASAASLASAGSAAQSVPHAPRSSRAHQPIPSSLVDAVVRRLKRNLPVRRTLPGKGRLHVDRQLPFLCVYRRPTRRPDAGMDRLVRGEAAYLIASGARRALPEVSAMLSRVVETVAPEFGAFLVLELWSAPDGGAANDPAEPDVAPRFTIHASKSAALARTVDVLQRRLEQIRILKQPVEVVVVRDGKGRPPRMRALLSRTQARETGCAFIGIEVPPVFRRAESGEVFPLLLRSLRRSLTLALRQTFFEFARTRTTHRPPHYHALGRQAVVKAVWEVDRQLAAVSDRFDYLLQLTPVNASAAFTQFRRGRFQRTPDFRYRPRTVDPSKLKRKLYSIPLGRVEDPALQRLFQEKQEELELKLTMLRDRDSWKFPYESLQLFGGVKDELLQLAQDLLARLPSRGRKGKVPLVDAASFAAQAAAELDRYRRGFPELQAQVRMSDEVSGLVVSQGTLLVTSELALAPARVPALLAHEVGTHLLTYANGRAQPFQQLHAGLASYEELQEGLAVFAEYLVGGLSSPRMRQLAGRVVAVAALLDGASFVETFRVLTRDHGFAQRPAYTTTMRVYRGGGLTKDAVYLRGLVKVLRFVQKGADLRTLWVGKLALRHVPIIRELQYRDVLRPAPVLPSFLGEGPARERLEALRGTTGSVLDLVPTRKSAKVRRLRKNKGTRP